MTIQITISTPSWGSYAKKRKSDTISIMRRELLPWVHHDDFANTWNSFFLQTDSAIDRQYTANELAGMAMKMHDSIARRQREEREAAAINAGYPNALDHLLASAQNAAHLLEKDIKHLRLSPGTAPKSLVRNDIITLRAALDRLEEVL